MQNFKLLVALMFAVAFMQLHGASESTSDSSRSRTSSKEFMKKLQEQVQKEESLPQFQLAAAIDFLQNNQILPIMVQIQYPKPEIKVRYDALLCFSARLKAYKSNLVSYAHDVDPNIITSTAQILSNHLASYRSNSSKIDCVVASQPFRALETKCQKIISESDL